MTIVLTILCTILVFGWLIAVLFPHHSNYFGDSPNTLGCFFVIAALVGLATIGLLYLGSIIW